ncbi:hypothetical protein A3A66_00710 [Microgenomates group bacterium RIFCSPLOWO2_01_FULL_46_13]|nr:MAG: hypothetical protein A3A66_00710 [Microgenomates group bacterium RIFCSPLOWO2_01_FULL_46_13]
MTQWDRFFDDKIRELSRCRVVVDVGGGRPFQKHLSRYRSLFRKVDYVSVDFVHTYRPTVVGNIHALPIRSEIANGLICKAVLEHVYSPETVVAELYRVGKKKSKLLVYVPFLYPYHGNRDYKDYYRFTHDGLQYLFRRWSQVEIVAVRGYAETISNLLPKPIDKLSLPLARIVDSLKPSIQTSGYYLFAVK